MKTSRTIRIRINNEIWNQLCEHKKQAGLKTISETTRSIISTGNAINLVELQAYRKELNRIGCNVNQLARAANERKQNSKDYSDFINIVIETRKKLDEYINALSGKAQNGI